MLVHWLDLLNLLNVFIEYQITNMSSHSLVYTQAQDVPGYEAKVIVQCKVQLTVITRVHFSKQSSANINLAKLN